MSQPTIVCQVCETQQPNAWDCAACGAALHEKPRHWTIAVPPIEGLEGTRLTDAGNVVIERLPGWEPTEQNADAAIPDLPLAGLEHTSFEPAAEVAASAPMPGFESHRLEPGGPSAPLSALACGACGTPWRPGASAFCERCGLRLSIPRARAGAPSAGTSVACPACGVGNLAIGADCPRCGLRIRGA
jgi:hypothetical protein